MSHGPNFRNVMHGIFEAEVHVIHELSEAVSVLVVLAPNPAKARFRTRCRGHRNFEGEGSG